MVLVDTSIWVSHLRDGDAQLKKLLNNGEVIIHPFIIGELACENIKNREEIFSLLNCLPTAEVTENKTVLEFIENSGLMGKGIGYIDVHLLASALISDSLLWSGDRKLNKMAEELKINYIFFK